MCNYSFEKLTPREFEVLAANYVHYVEPDCDWKLTRSVGDFNRDIEAYYDDTYKWGEAKHTEKPGTVVTKGRWDPTLLSACLKNNVNELYLITNGYIPLSYIVRSEHFKRYGLKRIRYINRFILEEWLTNKDIIFNNFGEKSIDINTILERKTTSRISAKCNKKPDILINIYSTIGNDQLEPRKQLKEWVAYELNITVFCEDDDVRISINLPDEVKAIHSRMANLSYNTIEVFDANPTGMFVLQHGYNQIVMTILPLSKGKFDCLIWIDNNKYSHSIQVVQNIESNVFSERELADCENLINRQDVYNAYKEIYYCNSDDFLRASNIGEYYKYSFNNSITENAKTLCSLASSMLLNIDFNGQDKRTILLSLNSSIGFCDFWLLDLAIGCADDSFAMFTVRNSVHDLEKAQSSIQKHSLATVKNRIYYIEGTENLTIEQNNFFNNLVFLFKSKNNSSCMFNNVMFSSLWEKALRYYNETKFYEALYYFSIICEKTDYAKIPFNLLFKYADCLNHCGSMKKAIECFQYIVTNIKTTEAHEVKLKMEAQTEIFNIRFWQLKTDNLVAEIDSFFANNKDDILSNNGVQRDLYAYYNILNRRMVTLYYQERYAEAENQYLLIIQNTQPDYNNYQAFAYMDSARGLYKKNIKEARYRLNCAFALLSKLKKKGKEQRRYYDCNVELAYVDFVIGNHENGNQDLCQLECAIGYIKINGYKNILLKCYLKLAACNIIIGKYSIAEDCLEFVARNTDFDENIRAKYLYDELNEKLKEIKSSALSASFNCYDEAGIMLETRIW